MAQIALAFCGVVCGSGIAMVCMQNLLPSLVAIIYGVFYVLSFLGTVIMMFPVISLWQKINREDYYWLVLTIVLGAMLVNALALVAAGVIVLMYLRSHVNMDFLYRPVFFQEEKPKMMQFPMPMMMAMPNY